MGIRARGGPLAPGAVVGDGRYRLLAQFGIDERAGAHLWRARDGQLRRDVALTMLVGDPADPEAARQARRTLERAAHAAKFEHVGVARVLDVLSLGSGISSSEGLLGIVVAEWTKGTDLVDLVADHPVAPGVAARMVQALTEAVDSAHQSGLVLGLDHPQRLRITPEQTLRLAFPGPLPDATLRDDVKAIGGVLYLLLTGRWALPGGPAAIPAAPRSPNGLIVPPRSLQPQVPVELSSLAVRTIEDGGQGGIRTSAAILRVLEQVAESEERTELVRPDAQAAVAVTDDDGTIWTTKKPVTDPQRRKKLALAVTALVVGAVAILAWIGLSLISFFQDDPGAGGPPINVAQPSASGSPQPNQTGQPTTQPPATGAPVKPASVTVYNPEGTGDNPGKAKSATDGNPQTVWSTDDYQQQLPALKSGVGLIAAFDKPVTLAQVQIESKSAGTVVEIRLGDSRNPRLSDTRVVASGTLNEPVTNITVPKPEQGQYVIVWITKLGGDRGKFGTEFSEIRYVPSA